MNDSQTPLVSIGLPVYNGKPHLEKALRTLLAQDYPNIELIVSDNASTDDTQQLCQSMLAGRTDTHYSRNAENIGALNNFLLVLAKARGKYFMWAAHDDYWNDTFVSSLVAKLIATPNAVLATPAALHVNEDGTLRSDPPDRPAPGKLGAGNLKVLLGDHAASWFYGIYPTEWLRAHLVDMHEYPAWGNDMLWLGDLCLRYPIVGSQDAMMFKRLRRSSFAPQTSRAVLWFWMYMGWYFTKNCFRRTDNWSERAKSLAICWRYIYNIGIRRPGLIRTAWRFLRIVTTSALSLIPLAIGAAWRKLRSASKPVAKPAATLHPPVAKPHAPVLQSENTPPRLQKSA